MISRSAGSRSGAASVSRSARSSSASLPTAPADLAGDVIGRVAGQHGGTIPRDDPVMLVAQAFDGLLERRLSTLTAPVGADLARVQHDAATRLQEAAPLPARYKVETHLPRRPRRAQAGD